MKTWLIAAMQPLDKTNILSAAVAALLSIVPSVSAQTYDIEDSFAAAQPTPFNPTGEFSSGRYFGGVNPAGFSLFSQFSESISGTGMDALFDGGDPNVIYNDTGATFTGFGFTQGDGEVSLGPAGGPVVVRFTAPFAGDFQITANFQRIQTTNAAATAFVFDNTTQVATGLADFAGFNYSDTLTLAFGDTIDFALSDGPATTRLQATLTVVPEPTSVALLGLGGLGLLVHRRRRC